VPGVVRAGSVPLRNPATDEEHHFVTVLPKGWVFYGCKGASGTAKATAGIKFDFANRHSPLAPFAFSDQRMAHS
jgi:hypothetical protein